MKKISLLALALAITIQLFSQKDITWTIEASDIDPNNYFGITTANGMIGIVSAHEPLSIQDIVLNGAFDLYGRGRVSNILKGFNFLDMSLNVDGMNIQASSIENFKQSLNMKEATFETSFNIPGKASVTQRVMALRHLPYSALIEFEITAKKNISVTPTNQIIAPNHLNDVRNYYSIIDRPHVQIPLMTSVAKSPTGKLDLAASISYLFPDEHHIASRIVHEDYDYNRHLTKFTEELKAGETLKFAVVGTMISTAHTPDAFNEAERLTIYAALEGKERLLKRHRMAWDELWQSDIIIEGDDEVQKDVRSMLYHLYSFARKGTAYSMSPMGLSGLGYNGHAFWDTEIWMYPPLLMMQPEIAKSLLEYRWEMLNEAKRNAFSHGYEGAMFPWESADTGQEATPVWALTGPFQHHITGDVSWAFWKYYQVTGDKEWLKERGYPMLKEVADFWISRVEKNESGGYDINNVIGANEYQENIDNNAYTNGMAKTVLGFATDAATELNITPNPKWAEVAAGIPILKFKDGTTRENATYNGEIIKQADANLLAYPMKIVIKEEDIKKDLAYYEQKMDPAGPAMGFSTLATLYAKLGNPEKAYELFTQCYRPLEVPPFGVLAEFAGGTNPYFATGAGGNLQIILAGFAGLDITDDGITQTNSNRPKKWKKLTITGVGIENKTFTVE